MASAPKFDIHSFKEDSDQVVAGAMFSLDRPKNRGLLGIPQQGLDGKAFGLSHKPSEPILDPGLRITGLPSASLFGQQTSAAHRPSSQQLMLKSSFGEESGQKQVKKGGATPLLKRALRGFVPECNWCGGN